MRAEWFAGLVAIMVTVLSGCASTTPVDYSYLRADDIAFRFDEGPGMRPPGYAFMLPQLTVLGDGRVVRLVVDPSNPYRWPELTQQKLTPTGMQRLLGAARDAGLFEATDFGDAGVLDGNVATFRVLGHKTEVANPGDGGTAARQRLRSLVGDVENLDSWMGSEISPAEPYSYSKAAVFAKEYDPQDPQNPIDQAPPWPSSSLGSGTPVDDGVCVIVDAVDLDQVKKASTEQGYQRSWSSNGSAYWVEIRPLLPGETDCASVVG